MKKWLKRLLLGILVIPTLVISGAVFLVFQNQESITQEIITTLNKDFKGKIELGKSNISPFTNFPYVSIDLKKLSVYPSKSDTSEAVLYLEDAYIGFSISDIIKGNYDVKSLKIKGGFAHIIQHRDGSFNIANAFATADSVSQEEIQNIDEALNVHLKKIQIDNFDLYKLNEASNTIYDVYITKAAAGFQANEVGTFSHLDSKFEFSLIQDGDTSFINKKHFDLNTDIAINNSTNTLKINPSSIYLEGSEFNLEGLVELENDMFLDLEVMGEKPNFDMFFAFAPNDIIPTLQKYQNEGKVFFDAKIKGKSINGNNPKIDVNFGCSNGYFKNTLNNKKLDDFQFKGNFTNGEQRDLSTMEFTVQNLSARPEAGLFNADISVKDFSSPDIKLKLTSQLELDFLSEFLNLEDLEDLKGKVKLVMNFRDIIDLESPEKSIERLNESYFTELEVENLSFKSPDFHIPIEDIDISAIMDGHEATIKNLSISAGNSDITLNGSVSDLPAIIHHTSKEVFTKLNIQSNKIDLHEITFSEDTTSEAVNEEINDLKMQLVFKSSAKAITESPYLPIGQFFIKDLNASLKHYPHRLHDFFADILIEEEDFRVIDFKGEIDQTDFHFNGKLSHYDLWFQDTAKGDTKMEFSLTSDLFRLKDVFTYKGENYVPEDYREEEFDDLLLHGYVDLHFKDSLFATDLNIDQLEAKMKMHPMRFEKFSGRIHYEDDNLLVKQAKGQVGKSDFTINLNYYLGKDSALKKRKNLFEFTSNHLDIDELTNFNPSNSNTELEEAEHDSAFNIYTLPFSNMNFNADIKHLNYHQHMLDDFFAQIRSTEDHYLYIDSLSTQIAEGTLDVKGYFNGSNPNLIYFSPDLKFNNIDIDQMLLKFENFGQDYVVNDQLHGKLSGRLTGKLHMHTDMVPSIDDSEIHIDIQVAEGRLENYDPLEYIAEYFKDKNLAKVLFDTLENHIDVVNGITTIPNMVIASSLGYIEMSGTQDMEGNFEYYFRVPLQLIKEAGRSKLFGRKKEIDENQEDEIIRKEDNPKGRYINIKMAGDSVDYNISLFKKKN